MKLLTLIYDSSIEGSMSELLDALEVPGYTKIADVVGAGGRGPKMNTAVFPGTNNLVYLVLPDDDIPRVHRAIRRLQNSYRLKPGVTILSQEVDEMP
jgi:hypothetical protein